jgi:hypothetical protein
MQRRGQLSRRLVNSADRDPSDENSLSRAPAPACTSRGTHVVETTSLKRHSKVLRSQDASGTGESVNSQTPDDEVDHTLWTLVREVSDAEAAFWALRNDSRLLGFVLRSQLLALVHDDSSVTDFLEAAQQPTDVGDVQAEFILCWVPVPGGPAILWRADYQRLIEEQVARRLSELEDPARKAALWGTTREQVERDTHIRAADGSCWLRTLPCPPSVIRALTQGQKALVQQVKRMGRYGRLPLHRAELLRLSRTCFSARFHILDAVGCGILVLDAQNTLSKEPYLCLPEVRTTNIVDSGEIGF